jgi:hypothetical protein
MPRQAGSAPTNATRPLAVPPEPERVRGMLSERALSRVIDCIHAGIDRHLGVAELASAERVSFFALISVVGEDEPVPMPQSVRSQFMGKSRPTSGGHCLHGPQQ